MRGLPDTSTHGRQRDSRSSTGHPILSSQVVSLHCKSVIVEVVNFCAAMDKLIDQDVEVVNFCAAMDTLIDQDVEVVNFFVQRWTP